jgi:hypothetical protein
VLGVRGRRISYTHLHPQRPTINSTQKAGHAGRREGANTFGGSPATVLGAGDSLQFVGYGQDATFAQNDATHWQVNYKLSGVAIDQTDYVFM